MSDIVNDTGLAPPPIRTPLVDESGYMASPWLKWLAQGLYQRVGGGTAITQDQLEAQFAASPLREKPFEMPDLETPCPANTGEVMKALADLEARIETNRESSRIADLYRQMDDLQASFATSGAAASDPVSLANVVHLTGSPETITSAKTFAKTITSTLGAITTSQPAVDATQTWNAGGVAFTGWKLNVTDTASSASSLMVDFQVTGSTVWNVTKQGYMYSTGVGSDTIQAGQNLTFNGSGIGVTLQMGAAGGFDVWCYSAGWGKRFSVAAAGAVTAVSLNLTAEAPTASTCTPVSVAAAKKVISRYDWTNAMITAYGAVLVGDVTVCVLPGKTVITNAYIVLKTQASGTTTLTASLGRVGTSFNDYITASDCKAAANTVYGDASGERGTNLTGYDLPTITGTTTVNLHFIATGANLSAVTNCTGSVYLETMILP